MQHLPSFALTGIKANVHNGWGGGELGPGFYTATTIAGAAFYLPAAAAGGVIEVRLNRAMLGHTVTPPQNWDYQAAGRLAELNRHLAHFDYLNNQHLPVTEYKFNYRCYTSLSVEAIHIDPNGTGWQRLSKAGFMPWYKENVLLEDPWN